jgi:hypothetical protein
MAEKTSVMDTMKRNLLRGFIPQIKANLANINPFIQEKLALVPLQEGETHAGYLLVSGGDGIAYIVTAKFNDDDKIVGVEENMPAVDFIENLLKLI